MHANTLFFLLSMKLWNKSTRAHFTSAHAFFVGTEQGDFSRTEVQSCEQPKKVGLTVYLSVVVTFLEY